MLTTPSNAQCVQKQQTKATCASLNEMNEKVETLVRTKSRQELVDMCKEKNLQVSGTKPVLARRLVGPFLKASSSSSSLFAPKSVPCIQLQLWTTEMKQVFVDMKEEEKCKDMESWQPEKDAYEPHTGFLFSAKRRRVMGVWSMSKQKFFPLTASDISYCREMKWPFDIPDFMDVSHEYVSSSSSSSTPSIMEERRQKWKQLLKGMSSASEVEEQEEEETEDYSLGE